MFHSQEDSHSYFQEENTRDKLSEGLPNLIFSPSLLKHEQQWQAGPDHVHSLEHSAPPLSPTPRNRLLSLHLRASHYSQRSGLSQEARLVSGHMERSAEEGVWR